MRDVIYLTLEDGSVYTGEAFGAPLKEDVTAEVVFTTSMTGYTETLTDPSYYGQMVVQTFPLIGNYGITPADFESARVSMSAYIVRESCESPSNFRSEMSLDEFLKKEDIPGMRGTDTRSLTKKIRQSGVMNGILSRRPQGGGKDSGRVRSDALSSFAVRDAVSHVTCGEKYVIPASIGDFRVVLWDFGAKRSIARELHARNCEVTALPASCTCDEIMSLNPDGVMLSNGPGNPKDNEGIIAEIKKLCEKNVPVFGICLGHQLLALANGADTIKLKYGHRGSNQPVKDTDTGRTYITSQNHGYAVSMENPPKDAKVRFVNLNDGTCEGLMYERIPAFSVQFHPEACAGPHDTGFLFDEFADLMRRRKKSCL